MRVKKYDEFVNEEINLKKALVGGALALLKLLEICNNAKDSK